MMETEKNLRKKSELYSLAAAAVIVSDYDTDTKLDVIELLLDRRSTALFTEQQEANENGKHS